MLKILDTTLGKLQQRRQIELNVKKTLTRDLGPPCTGLPCDCVPVGIAGPSVSELAEWIRDSTGVAGPGAWGSFNPRS